MAAPATSGGDQPAGTENLNDILKTYAAQVSPYDAGHAGSTLGGTDNTCAPRSSSLDPTEANAALKSGDWLRASVDFKAIAEVAAYCAVGPQGSMNELGPVDPQYQMPLNTAYDETGASLAMAVIAESSTFVAGVRDWSPEDVQMARDAMALMGPNAGAHAEIIKALKATGALGTTPMAPVAGSASARLTAKAAIAAYNDNAFAFNHKYGNSDIAITGYIANIGGSGNTAYVELVGYAHKDLSKSGYQAMVRCEIETEAALDAVSRLRKGQRATVQGTVNTRSGLPGVDLEPCLATPI